MLSNINIGTTGLTKKFDYCIKGEIGCFHFDPELILIKYIRIGNRLRSLNLQRLKKMKTCFEILTVSNI